MRVFVIAALVLTLIASVATAETLSWDPVTKYADGTTISAPVTYQAYWTIDNTLATGMTALGSATSTTSVTFAIDTAGMPRGSTIYLTCRSKVQGVESVNATPLSWLVPTKAPSAPASLRLN